MFKSVEDCVESVEDSVKSVEDSVKSVENQASKPNVTSGCQYVCEDI